MRLVNIEVCKDAATALAVIAQYEASNEGWQFSRHLTKVNMVVTGRRDAPGQNPADQKVYDGLADAGGELLVFWKDA
jgi:hypothetical protein